MNTLEDKVAVVTGAASGIGRAIAQSLADRGAHIVAVDINAGELATVVGELRDLGVTVVPCATDVGDARAFDRIRDTALARLDRVDIVSPVKKLNPRVPTTIDADNADCTGLSGPVTGNYYIDPTSFECANIAPFTFGTLGRNSIRCWRTAKSGDVCPKSALDDKVRSVPGRSRRRACLERSGWH